MLALDVKHRKMIRSGTKYYFDVRIRNPNDTISRSVSIVIRRPSSSLCPIHILDWRSRDHGNPPDEKWNLYYFPQRDIHPRETAARRIPFDVSSAVNLGIEILWISVIATEEGSRRYYPVNWKKLLLIIVPKRRTHRITGGFARKHSLWDYLPPLPKYGWTRVHSSTERRNVSGFIEGISASYSLNEKTVGIFIFSFDSSANAQSHFRDKLAEWKNKSAAGGEESLLVYRGLRIKRYVFPKTGIIFGWIVETLIFVIYAPTAEEEDLRKIVNLMFFGSK